MQLRFEIIVEVHSLNFFTLHAHHPVDNPHQRPELTQLNEDTQFVGMLLQKKRSAKLFFCFNLRKSFVDKT